MCTSIALLSWIAVDLFDLSLPVLVGLSCAKMRCLLKSA
uniref:Uncharacterized protein n=1 Tax=Rhizophora mucronata TaxID=61149 RepID=A0A2P2Q1M4_RHIMU